MRFAQRHRKPPRTVRKDDTGRYTGAAAGLLGGNLQQLRAGLNSAGSALNLSEAVGVGDQNGGYQGVTCVVSELPSAVPTLSEVKTLVIERDTDPVESVELPELEEISELLLAQAERVRAATAERLKAEVKRILCIDFFLNGMRCMCLGL